MLRHFLRRDLDAEIAARHHDPVGRVHDRVEPLEGLAFLDLRDEERGRAARVDDLPRARHVGGAPHEGEGDGVHAEREAEREIAAVLLREGCARDPGAGKVESLPRGENPAVHDAAADVGSGDRLDDEMDRAVGEVDVVSGAQLARQPRVGHVRAALVAGDFARREGEELPVVELDLPAPQLADADLRPRKVLHDRESGRDAPERLEDRAVLLVRSMGEVEPGDVHAGVDERLELLPAPACGPDRADDLRESFHRDPSRASRGLAGRIVRRIVRRNRLAFKPPLCYI